tara:strand:+ start:2845 stop:4005 length:1161 start_codon:yes stop_codon:yes gene_type:complete
MAIGEDALEGLDLSVLQNITVNPDEDAKKDKEKDESPSIFEPQLKIQEVDEIPEEKKEEVKVEEVEPSEEVKEEIKDEPASETKTEDKEEPVSETTEASETEEETENAFRIFAEMQRDKGLIDFKDEEFEENDEWLLSKISETIEYKVNEYKDTIPSEIKYLLDNYEAGVPLGDLINMQNKEQAYEAISVEALQKSDSLQKNVVRDLLIKTGWSEERANKKIQRYEDAGVLHEEAEEALSSLVEMQKQEKEQFVQNKKLEQQQRIEAHEKWLVDLKDHIGKKEEILPGFKLSPKDKDNLYKGITKLDRQGKNEIMRLREKDPEFDLKIAYLATVLKWDFSAFERQSTTKSTRKLADVIKSTKKTGSRPSRGTSKAVNFDTMRKSLR